MHWDDRRFQKREREQGAYHIYEHVIRTQDRALFALFLGGTLSLKSSLLKNHVNDG
jgi:hypothetical protein